MAKKIMFENEIEPTISNDNKIQIEKLKNPYFVVNGISKTFKNGAGVKDITFSITKGEIVGFIGDNGAGKTTTIKLIFGEHKKDAGSVSLEGIPSTDKTTLNRIAFFPDQNNFPKKFNIVEYAYYCASLKGLSRKEVGKYIDMYLEGLDLLKFKKNKFDELSARMQKRALLLSTLVTDPEIIVLDEPTANLDVKSRLEFMEILDYLSKEHGKTIMITSHNIDELNNLVNRAILVKKINNRGQVIYDKYFDKNTENLRDVYINAIGKNDSGINFEKIKKITELKEAEREVK
ncbi:ABC transporter ATP-binding protein [[Acholeplasma] multilocale]|uniref:ABC transporter ATP-binding protein n=1 Tax=[Acholeplasma] multilocale TaxID=264638 RepID=UPI000427DAAD|nr:ABC transporter ATP-binding protein [[Acholeplasma] multilocale]